MKIKFLEKFNWKALERVSLLFGVILSIVGLQELISRMLEDEKHNSDLFGIWESRYSYSSASGSHEIIGTTEYFKNGNYNFVGKMILKETAHYTTLSHNLQLSGEWETDSENLFTKVIDIKSVLIPNESFSKTVSHQELISKSSHFSIESFIAKGTTEKFGLQSLDDNSIVLTSLDPRGNIFSIRMERKNQRFQY